MNPKAQKTLTVRGAQILAAGAALLSAVLIPAQSAQAQAAEPVPFTITEQINSTAGVTTFTATGPLCPSGTFEDDVKVGAFAHSEQAQSGGGNLLIHTVYTCDDGSGTFNALKHVFLTRNDSGFTSTGPIQLLGGTGAYANLVGHGVDNGSFSYDTNTGVGQISGFVG
jgi:hypothetical protein